MKKNIDPVRMCCVCRTKKQKSQLWRIALTNDQAVLDRTGKADGRGLYVCRNTECVRLLYKKKARHHPSAVSLRPIIDELLAEEKADG